MEFLIDSVNVENIKHILEYYPIAGITCNPTIIARNGVQPYKALEEIKSLMGDRHLHVQIISHDVEGILEEAKVITDRLGKETYIKVPVDEVGLKAIKALKDEGYNVTATAVYTSMQAILAAKQGADYIAPYFNRIEDLGYDALEVVSSVQDMIDIFDLDAKILGASFKNNSQVLALLHNGIDAVTISDEMILKMMKNDAVEASIASFKNDFEDLCGENKTMKNCD